MFWRQPEPPLQLPLLQPSAGCFCAPEGRIPLPTKAGVWRLVATYEGECRGHVAMPLLMGLSAAES